ncbi:MAG: exodeoxyribonuclease VII large subunit [Mangrovibacterium sp.]
MNEAITLSQLNREVQRAIKSAFPRPVWLVGEISEMNVNRNGHCYLELVEIDERSQGVIARTRATIWSYSFHMLKSFFESSTQQTFRSGIKIMVEASVEFHELYGFSLNIKNINPTYTLGDMAQKRKAIIEKLKADGVFDMNRELELPFVPQRIAIISSPTAAGLQDFMNQLHHNTAQIAFHTELFAATMQGEQTVPSVILALEDIAERMDDFDLVVIIRGGGAQLDLANFDDYDLANNVAQFPLPIITGIGHDKDETVIDLVAYLSLKTPTAVAEFLVSGAFQFHELLNDLQYRLIDSTRNRLEDENEDLTLGVNRLKQSVRNRMEKEELKLENMVFKTTKVSQQFLHQRQSKLDKNLYILSSGIPLRMKTELQHFDHLLQTAQLKTTQQLQQQQAKLEVFELRKRLTDPKKILKRGYSVLYKNGKLIKNSTQLNEGDEIETQLANGRIKSTVIK